MLITNKKDIEKIIKLSQQVNIGKIVKNFDNKYTLADITYYCKSHNIKYLNNNELIRKEMINKVFVNNQGSKFKIIEYINANKVKIQFIDEYKYELYTNKPNIQKGNIRNPYYKSVYNVGYIGKIKLTLRKAKEYKAWQSMLLRCYNKKEQERSRNKTYKNCTVCEEWHNFTNFYNWITKQENYNLWKNNKHWHVDKDILKQGNKEYSPNACCLVPDKLNIRITKNTNSKEVKNEILKMAFEYYKKKEITVQCYKTLLKRYK